MSERAFLIAVLITVGFCLAFTLAHLFYAVYDYEHCSIIYFIGKELW